MVLILLGNIVHYLIIIISHKIGFVFSVMKHDMHRLLCCLACDCNYHCDEKLRDVNFKSETVYCLRTIGGFWSFLKLYMYSQLKLLSMQLCLKKAKAAWDAIVYWENSKSGEITSKVSSGKNTLTVVTSGRHSTVIMLVDIHKQAIEKRNWQVEFERHAEEQSNEKQPWDFVYTSFLLFCYLNDAKCHLNFFKVSTQSITQAVRMNANFLKSCQLQLFLEFV